MLSQAALEAAYTSASPELKEMTFCVLLEKYIKQDPTPDTDLRSDLFEAQSESEYTSRCKA